MDSGPVQTVLLMMAAVTPNGLLLANLIILVLIVCSALMSASEIAFFSLSKADLDQLRSSEDPTDNRVAALLDRPRYLLSSILVTNNMVNIGVVITSYFVTRGFFDLLNVQHVVYVPLFDLSISREVVEFVWNVLIVTFFLVLFGEALPKVFATQNKLKIARFMSRLLGVLNKIFFPLNYILIGSTQVLEKRLKQYNAELDIEEINKAIEITVEKKESKQDAKLLKDIVHFGSITVKQVMRPRTEVYAIDSELNFKDLMQFVREMRYSRFPVYKESLDTVIGTLNIKDLLAHYGEPEDFEWQKFIRDAFFVPETKKIDDLLRDIQQNRKHLAIVVDEFGGTAGIITLEDIVEEVVGDIKDEFDEATETNFRKLDERNFMFEGKTSLQDVTKLLEHNEDFFDAVRGEAETLGGLLLEIAHRIPKNGEELRYGGYKFTIISVTNNRIERVKVTNENKIVANAKDEG